MSVYTWNVIFMGLDFKNPQSENNESLSQTIQTGIDIFTEDISKSVYSEQLKITFLKFQSNEQVGNAIVYENVDNVGKNDLEISYLIPDFNCLSVNNYADFFEKTVSKNCSQINSKYIIFFLAHSFGAGFFPIENKKISSGDTKYDYFTTIQLNDSIIAGFKEIKVDCLIGLTCYLQSVESNYIFSKTVKYMIGSQQPLEMKAIGYKQLLADLAYKISIGNKTKTIDNRSEIGLDDEIIFSKFIYDCYSKYKKQINNTHGGIKFDNFSLSLSKPEGAIEIEKSLNSLCQNLAVDFPKEDLKPLGIRNIDYWTYASRFCVDPSYTQVVNIIDAIQFFLKFRTFFLESANHKKIHLIDKILLDIRATVLLNVASPTLCKAEIEDGNLLKMFLPLGMGIFIPKLLSVNLKELLNIFEKLHKPKIHEGQDVQDATEELPFIPIENGIAYISKFSSLKINYMDKEKAL